MFPLSDSAPALEYQRSIVASMVELLEGYQAVLPVQPAQFVWDGAAQRSYAEGLALLREELWHLHSLLVDALHRCGLANA